MPEGVLRQYAHLSEADHYFLRGQRRDVNRLGCALQLVVLRVFAHLPERWWTQVPAAPCLDFVAAQLPVEAGVFAAYGQRGATVYERFQQVRQHQLTVLLREYGRLLETNFILHYLQSQPLRRRSHAHLNKGSSCTRCVAGCGSAATGPCAASFGEQQQETVRCLNLPTNLVVVWNTVYTGSGHPAAARRANGRRRRPAVPFAGALPPYQSPRALLVSAGRNGASSRAPPVTSRRLT